MAEEVLLRRQIPDVSHVRGGRESHSTEHVEPGIRESASSRGEPKVLIRLQRVETAILEHVRSQLVGQTDPSTLVAGGVHEHAATFGGDRSLCLAKLDAT